MDKTQRLSDRVLDVFELALEQKDVAIAEMLSEALIMALTRQAGGKDFTERRNVDERVLAGLDNLNDLKKGKT